MDIIDIINQQYHRYYLARGEYPDTLLLPAQIFYEAIRMKDVHGNYYFLSIAGEFLKYNGMDIIVSDNVKEIKVANFNY